MKDKLFALLSLSWLRGHNLTIRFPFLKPFYAVYQACYRVLQPQDVKVFGLTMYVGSDEVEHARQGEQYERETTEAFQQIVRPGDVVVDVGANIGYFTLLAESLAGPTGRVYAFEPNVTHYAVLEKNIHANGLSNVYSFAKAVADRSGKGAMDGDVLKTGGGDSVDVVALDDVIHGEVKLVKMDIEGGEPKAFRGMRRIITENPLIVVILEHNEPAMRAQGEDPAAFLDELENAGFSVKRLGPKSGVQNILCSRNASIHSGPSLTKSAA